jgi:AcrR family transcriptional regulator
VAEPVAVAGPAKRRPGRPRNTSSEDTKLRVLEAAVDCFAEGGFDGTASLTIAERAGVTPATIYHHFANKRTLYLAAFQHSIDVAWRQYADVADGGHPSVVDEIMAVIRRACVIMRERPAMTLLAIRAQVDVAVADIDIDAVTGLFEGMVTRAVGRGELRQQDALLFAESVAMFLWGLSVVGRHDDATRTRCADALERVLRHTLITT